MLNIYYNPRYFTSIQKKSFITKKLKFSIFFDLLISFFYFFNLPYPRNMIFYGPQMRMHHLIKTFKGNKGVYFNTNKSSNSYIVQFDSFGENALNEIIKHKSSDTKVLVGPLFTNEMDIRLNNYMDKYPFIKKIVASETALEAQRVLHGNIDEKNIIICPSGIRSISEISTNYSVENKYIDCLVYFKKRDLKELKLVENFLNKRGLSYKILKYGDYKQKELSMLSKVSKFGFILNKTESQGFATQFLMSENLPLVVWDYPFNSYEGFKIKSTSVPWWDDYKCGIRSSTIEELEKSFDDFFLNIKNYSPAEYVQEKLTYEVYSENLLSIFNSKLWPIQNK
jgi:hypothetical protein